MLWLCWVYSYTIGNASHEVMEMTCYQRIKKKFRVLSSLKKFPLTQWLFEVKCRYWLTSHWFLMTLASVLSTEWNSVCWKNPVAQFIYSKYWYRCLCFYFTKLQNFRPTESFKPNRSQLLTRTKGLGHHIGVWEDVCLSYRKWFRHCRNLVW